MYGKPNKTEKKIIRAWKADSIDEAYAGVFNSGWCNDLTVYLTEAGFVQNMPKVHPDVITLLNRVPISTARLLADSLRTCQLPIMNASPVIVNVTDNGGVVRTVMPDGTGAKQLIVFRSPVNIECIDRNDKPVWSVMLIHGGTATVKFNGVEMFGVVVGEVEHG